MNPKLEEQRREMILQSLRAWGHSEEAEIVVVGFPSRRHNKDTNKDTSIDRKVLPYSFQTEL